MAQTLEPSKVTGLSLADVFCYPFHGSSDIRIKSSVIKYTDEEYDTGLSLSRTSEEDAIEVGKQADDVYHTSPEN